MTNVQPRRLPNKGSIQKGEVRNPNGMPRRTIPASKLPLITKMIAEGKRERHVALMLQMSTVTWARCKKDSPEVADALALGQEMLYDQIVGGLIGLAKKGNVIAGIFLGKCLCGLREQDDPSELRPQITINLPGAASLDKYQGLTIEHEGKRLLTKEAQRA